MKNNSAPSLFGHLDAPALTLNQPLNRPVLGAASTLAITIPHTLGLGLLAFAPIANQMPVATLALWSAALPGTLMTLLARSPGVIYAPSTAVALLFGGMLTLVMQAGASQGITIAQALAITGAFCALAFAIQWLFGRTGLASFARFLPVSVAQGFSAGIGLSLIASQFRTALGAGSWTWDKVLAWHAGIALAVAVLSVLIQRRWPRVPGVLLALLLLAVLAQLLAPANLLQFVASSPVLTLPPLPDWANAPWLVVLNRAAVPLASLALLMAMVNGLEVLVFYQELEIEHGVRNQPGTVLMRESMLAALCALAGMIPSTTSPSRSRTALLYTQPPGFQVGNWHALVLLGVAFTGYLWLAWLPLSCLAGALLVAGMRMIPVSMLNFKVAAIRRASLLQSWVVALFFAFTGGVMALTSGLIISTIVLLRASATHAIRRVHLHGNLRSRHSRPAALEAWLSERMSQVAVFELQGIVSFGVAALVVEQVRLHVQAQRCVILDAARVPAWDDTGYAHLRALGRQLHAKNIALVLSGARGNTHTLGDLHSFKDLDHALEWAENQLLLDCPADLRQSSAASSPLGELRLGLPESARQSLESRLTLGQYTANALLFRSGDIDRTLLLVQAGQVLLTTSAKAQQGLRLEVLSHGMVFGEMAFLSGNARTAFAWAGAEGCTVLSIQWEDYQAWARQEPAAALVFMSQLALMGIRRLGGTSRQLRAAME